ncbi:hypothetical protein EBR66_06675 [bacterium]|nr:hypothetical protein [bacterium]
MEVYRVSTLDMVFRPVFLGVLLALLGAVWAVHTYWDSPRARLPFETLDSYVRGQVLVCLNSGVPLWRSTCFDDLSRQLMERFSLPEVLKSLAQADDDFRIKQQCHPFAHNLGQRSFEKTQSLAETFAQCSTRIACGEGCFHGAVEAYVMTRGSVPDAPVLSRVCSRSFSLNETNYLACVHGLGHAFMLLYENDIHKALPGCDVLSTKTDRDMCYAGVFMENVFSFGNPLHPTPFIDFTDPMYPCKQIGSRYQEQCLSAAASQVLQQNRGNVVAAAQFCSELPPRYQPECYGTIGGTAVFLSADTQKSVRDACALAPQGAASKACIREALRFVLYSSGGKNEALTKLCSVFMNDDRSACLAQASASMREWAPFGTTTSSAKNR